MVPKTHAVWYQGRRQTAAKLVDRLPEEVWGQSATGIGAYNVHRQEWACLPLSEACPAGLRRWLLVRRSSDEPRDLAYFLVCGPEATSEAELLRVCRTRWQLEECFAQAKGEVGLDHYEVRTWQAWHRFVTLCLLAHAYLVVLRCAAQQEEAEEKGARIVA